MNFPFVWHRIGRQLLLRLLRADGPNRGAWADPARMTPEVVDLYRRSSKLQGWGNALIEVCLGLKLMSLES
jgi:hypothetical protein